MAQTKYFYTIKRTRRGHIGLVRGKYNVRGLPLTVLSRETSPRKSAAAAKQACIHTIAALEAVDKMPRCGCGHVLTELHTGKECM